MGNQITIHQERGKELCRIVVGAYENRKKLFSNPNIKKDMCPEKLLIDEIEGKERKAKWLFFACADMQRKNSRLYFEQFRDFYLEDSYHFDNENLKKLSKFGVGIHFDESQTREMLNSIKLLEEYEGNPLKIIEQGKDINDILRKLKRFNGFGIKQSKMYLLFLAKYNLADLNTKEIGLPVDSHLIKISSACRAFDFEEGTRVDKSRIYLDKMYSDIIKNEKIDSLILNSAIWIIGNKVCTKNNESSCKLLCPLENICSKNFPEINRYNTRLYKKESTRKHKGQGVLPLFEK